MLNLCPPHNSGVGAATASIASTAKVVILSGKAKFTVRKSKFIHVVYNTLKNSNVNKFVKNVPRRALLQQRYS